MEKGAKIKRGRIFPCKQYSNVHSVLVSLEGLSHYIALFDKQGVLRPPLSKILMARLRVCKNSNLVALYNNQG